MASNDSLEISIKLDETGLKAQAKKLGAELEKGLAVNQVAAKTTDKIAQSLAKSVERYKQLAKESLAFDASNKQSAQSLSKIYSEQARLISAQRNLTSDTEERNKLLQQQVGLLNQASEASKKFRNSSSNNSLSIERPSSKQNILEGAASVGLGVSAAGLASGALAGLNQLADKAKEAANNISDSGGGFDQLRQSSEQLKQAQDKLAVSAGSIKFAELRNSLEYGLTKFVSDLSDKLLPNIGSGEDPEQAQRKAQLVGDSRIDQEGLKRTRLEGEQDLAREQIALERNLYEERRDLALEGAQLERAIFQENRDLAIEKQKLEIDATRKSADFEKQRGRLDEDFQIKTKKFYEDIEGQVAAINFQNQRERASRDFSNSQRDKAQDFGIKQGDKAADFSLSQSRNVEDYQNSVVDMALSNSSGTSFLQASRNFRKTQRRAQEDFSTQQGRDKRDFSIGQERDTRDFKNEELDAQIDRSIELKKREIERGYELADMQLQYKRSTEDLNTEVQRFTEDLSIARQELANKEEDLAFSQNMRRQEFSNKQEDFAFSETKQRDDFSIRAKRERRGFDESEQSFANDLYKNNSETFKQLAKDDPKLKADLDAYRKRAGLDTLDKNYAILGKDGKPVTNNTTDNAGKAAGFLSDSLANSPVGLGLKTGLSLLFGKNPFEEDKDKLKKYDTGGYVDKTGPAFLHAGEFVVNPNGSDKERQRGFALSALGGMTLSPMQPNGLGSMAGNAPAVNVSLGGINAPQGLTPQQVQNIAQQHMNNLKGSLLAEASRNSRGNQMQGDRYNMNSGNTFIR
jgi:hypothetical protein